MQFPEDAHNLSIHFYFRGFARVQVINGINGSVGNVRITESAQKEFDASLHVEEVEQLANPSHPRQLRFAKSGHHHGKFARLILAVHF